MKTQAAVDTSLLRYSMAREVPGRAPTYVNLFRPPWGLSVTRSVDEPVDEFWTRVTEVADALRREVVRAGLHPPREPMWLTVLCHYEETSAPESDLLEACRQPLRKLIGSPSPFEDLKIRAAVALAALTMK